MNPSQIRNLIRRIFVRDQREEGGLRRRLSRPRARLGLEHLEERELLSTNLSQMYYYDRPSFLSATGAAPVAEFENMGKVGGASATYLTTDGKVRVSLGPQSTELHVGGGPGGVDWTTRLAGTDIAISARENLNLDLHGSAFAFGFDFLEPRNDPNVGGTFVDSLFTVTLKTGNQILSSFVFNAPNDTPFFVGASSVQPFNRVEIRETVGGSENEFFGRFYLAGNSTTTSAVPGAPSGLTASAASSSQINLNWSDNSNNENGFMIQRKIGSSSTWWPIAMVGANVTSYQDTGLFAGTTYYYRVLAYNTSSGNSGYSNETIRTTQTVPTVTILQNNVAVTNLSGASASERAFKLMVPSGASNLKFQIAGGSGDADLYVKFGAQPSTSIYDYRPWLNGNNETVTPSSAAMGDWYVMIRGYSSYSGVSLTASYSAAPTAPAAPSDLVGSAASASQVNLFWRDNSNNETGFQIERKTGSLGTWSQIATVGTGTSSYQVTGLSAGTTYYFRVRATNTAGNSGYSNEISQTTPTISTVTTLQNNVAVTNLSGASASERVYKLIVPSGASNLKFQIAGGSGDADLYVKFGAQPTTSSYDYRPWLNGNNETVTPSSAATGDWYVMIRGFSSYSGVSLTASFNQQITSAVTGRAISGGFFSLSQFPTTYAPGATWPYETAMCSSATGITVTVQNWDANYLRFDVTAPSSAYGTCRLALRVSASWTPPWAIFEFTLTNGRVSMAPSIKFVDTLPTSATAALVPPLAFGFVPSLPMQWGVVVS